MTPALTPSQTVFQTIEVAATIDENGVLSAPLLVGVPPGEVRLFVLVAPPQPQGELDYSLEEITEEQWRRGMQNSSALAFLADPAEDIYTTEDGEPIEWNKP